MPITYTAGYTYVNGEIVTPTKANTAQTGFTITLATSKLLGRSTAGTGVMEEIDYTAAGLALLQAADVAAQQAILGGTGARARCTAQVDVTDTTYTDVTGMTVNVTSGQTYTLEAFISFSTPGSPTNSAGKLKLTGTATVSSINGFYMVEGQSAGFDSGATGTSLPIEVTILAYVTGVMRVSYTFVCNGTGTMKLQFAQNVASGGTSSVLLGSYMKLFAY